MFLVTASSPLRPRLRAVPAPLSFASPRNIDGRTERQYHDSTDEGGNGIDGILHVSQICVCHRLRCAALCMCVCVCVCVCARARTRYVCAIACGAKGRGMSRHRWPNP